MKRREFISLLGGGAVAWPLSVRAQTAKQVSRLGMLTIGSAPTSHELAFRQRLRELGYVEGESLLVEFRGAAGRTERLAGLAVELVALKADVVFAVGSQATQALRQATSGIPIVFISTDPVGMGFVASLARPGGNATGLSLQAPEASGKRMELLKEIVPALVKVAVLWNPDDPSGSLSLKETRAAAQTLAVELQILETRDVDAFDGAFLAATGERAQAVIVLPSPLMNRNAGRIADLALRSKLPTIYFSDDLPKAGGLISYGVSFSAVHRRAADYVDRILKGAKPADLPVEQPTRFDLVINLKTAKALGLVLSPNLLVRADEVVSAE